MNRNALLLILFSSATTLADQPPKPDISVGTFWESKYVSEGRNNLADGGIATLDATAEWTNVALATWLVSGTSEDYQELQFTAEFRNTTRNLDYYAGYTRLQFPASDESDNELTAGVTLTGLPYVSPAIDYTFSTGASAGFVEVSLSSEQTLINEQLTLKPYVLQALDFGYASKAYDGVSNFQLGVEVAVSLNETLGIAGSLSHAIAMEDVERAGQGNTTWFTIGLQGSF